MEMLTEKLDLRRLAKLAGVHRKEGTPFVSVTPDEIDLLIARIRALESRASNAGGAVAVTAKQRYDESRCAEEESSPVERLRFFCSLAMDGQDWIDVEPFFDALPAPASKEPVADERCNRCGHENHSGSCVNVHPDKTPIKQESTRDGLRDCLQKMVDANLEDSLGPNHLALCLKQMAYEALELIQKVQPVADERERFEAWADERPYDLPKFQCKQYVSHATECAWDGWQARAALAAAPAKGV
ncbi:hypothetical protein [Cupriavidus campinensis]|uniref:Uncharacterized protein n=1 Tax=Cupriavidus campinensis TaxID=151783 RepID=A0ABY3EKK6_9BURK|nr:hypothetical protein [Cupriavidus campinensis]TSP11474.1 hypothetical protein FGG12_17715 [Cupriavidus campinensis]